MHKEKPIVTPNQVTGTITIQRVCTTTKKVFSVEINRADLASFQAGKSAEVAFPYLTVAQREFIKFNVTPAEWN